ncbi:hypothetical protein Acr_05g0011930 [Actinidia rufa]|uniref:Uncharacterized protein n=1 Tax=Actinidia rufa TaxID=165716 RepID=A0A7J0EM53_9ERIC|nr:hypothetical protein Acr_05g0011930 [Actinidia rufa]
MASDLAISRISSPSSLHLPGLATILLSLISPPIGLQIQPQPEMGRTGVPPFVVTRPPRGNRAATRPAGVTRAVTRPEDILCAHTCPEEVPCAHTHKGGVPCAKQGTHAPARAGEVQHVPTRAREALLLLSSLLESWEIFVVSLNNSVPNGKLTMSMVMDALFNEEARRREMGSIDYSESQALVSEGSKERGRGQGRGHHRVLTTCVETERCSLHMQHARDMYGWRIIQLAELLANDQFSSAWQMGGDVVGKKTRGLYRLEESVQTGGTTIRHGSSGISKKNGQKKQPLHKDMQSKRMGCPKRSSEEGDKVDFEEPCSDGREAGPEAIRMDNLKISDYPPMGWWERLLKSSPLG